MTVQELYETIGGNYQEAVNRMMNDNFIARMLGKFLSSNSYGNVVQAYEEKDFKKLFDEVHSFKGVTGNLALTPLFDLAYKITEATRNLAPGESVNLDNEIKELKEKYQLTVDTITKFQNQ